MQRVSDQNPALQQVCHLLLDDFKFFSWKQNREAVFSDVSITAVLNERPPRLELRGQAGGPLRSGG